MVQLLLLKKVVDNSNFYQKEQE